MNKREVQREIYTNKSNGSVEPEMSPVEVIVNRSQLL